MASNTQVDLFIDSLADAPIKDERALMEFPFFSLQKRPRMTPFIYDDGKVKIEIQPGAKGIATIWDKDILIYLTSMVNERLERGMPSERTLSFAAHDFLRITGRGTGKKSYELFLDALHRLRSTNILTSIEAAGDRERRGFGWIEDWRVVERTNSNGKRVMGAVEVTLNRWMFNAIVKDRRVLTINKDYFTLKKGLERRLYELARKHVGRQPEWFVGLRRLYMKCGSADTVRKFKFRLQEIADANTVPDYRLELVDSQTAKTPFKSKRDEVLIRFTPIRAVEVVPDVPNHPPPLRRLIIMGDTHIEAKKRFPGYDTQYLEQVWREWALKKTEPIRNPDGAFLAFCKTYTETNPL